MDVNSRCVARDYKKLVFSLSLVSGEEYILELPDYERASVRAVISSGTAEVYDTTDPVSSASRNWVLWDLGAISATDTLILSGKGVALKFKCTAGSVLFSVVT